MNYRRALVLSPHSDDGELGCGGTVVRLLEEGCSVYWMTFSFAEKSTPSDFSPGVMREEMDKAMEVLGVKPENIYRLDYEVRTFPDHRQEILDRLYAINMELQPDLVFCHTRDDCHQDHRAVTDEAIRAFKNSTILGYELPWNCFRFPSDCFMELSEAHLDTKVRALGEYKSRLAKRHLHEQTLRSLAITRGVQVNTEYAESFEVIRMVNRLAG